MPEPVEVIEGTRGTSIVIELEIGFLDEVLLRAVRSDRD